MKYGIMDYSLLLVIEQLNSNKEKELSAQIAVATDVVGPSPSNYKSTMIKSSSVNAEDVFWVNMKNGEEDLTFDEDFQFKSTRKNSGVAA